MAQDQHPGAAENREYRPLISQEELDALVSALRSVATSKKRRPGRHLTVSLFDFRHTVQLSPEELRSIEAECQNLCRVLSRTMVPYLNVATEFSLLSVGVANVDQFIHNFAATPVVCVFRLEEHSSLAMWEITPPLAFAIVEYMLGSSQLSPPPAREMTTIETSIIKRFFKELLSIWKLTWHALEETDADVDFVTTSVAKIDMRQVEANVVHVVFQVRVGDREGTMNLGLPVSVLRSLMREQRGQGEEAQRRIEDIPPAMENVRVDVAVRLPAAHIPLAELKTVREGEIIPLGVRTDSPFIIYVNDVPKFTGESGMAEGRMAVRITEPIE